jgi:hypothetical protein
MPSKLQKLKARNEKRITSDQTSKHNRILKRERETRSNLEERKFRESKK